MGSIDELSAKVRTLFNEAFAPAEVGVSTRDGIVLFVVSEKFEKMDDMERQEVVWGLLEKSLNRDEQRAIAIVVALTPKERSFHLAGHID